MQTQWLKVIWRAAVLLVACWLGFAGGLIAPTLWQMRLDCYGLGSLSPLLAYGVALCLGVLTAALAWRVVIGRKRGVGAVAALLTLVGLGVFIHVEALAFGMDHLMSIAMDPHLGPLVTATKGIASRLEELSIEPVESAGQVLLGDFVLSVPRGWEVLEEHHREGIAPSVLLRVPSGGPEPLTVEVTCASGKDELFVTNNPFGGYMPAEKMFSLYPTDWDLFVHIYDAVPLDLKYAFGSRGKRVKALLRAKGMLHICLPARRLDCPSLRAFVGPQHPLLPPERGSVVWTQLFDLTGASRADLRLKLPPGISWEAAEHVIGSLLWNSRFEGSQTDAGRGQGSLSSLR